MLRHAGVADPVSQHLLRQLRGAAPRVQRPHGQADTPARARSGGVRPVAAAIQPLIPRTLPAPTPGEAADAEAAPARQQYGLRALPEEARRSIEADSGALLDDFCTFLDGQPRGVLPHSSGGGGGRAAAIVGMVDTSRTGLEKVKDAEAHRKRIEQFIGYLYTFRRVAAPHVFDVADALRVAAFISFKAQREVSRPHMLATLCTFKYAVTWLRASRPEWAGAGHQDHLQRLLDWNSELHRQLKRNYVEPVGVGARRLTDPEELTGQGRWLPAPQLLAAVAAKRAEALTAVREDDPAGAAPVVQDALICMFSFGYLASVRPSVVASLTCCPPAGGGGCPHPACQHPRSCAGNRVWQDQATGAWMLEVVHHKTERAAGREAPLRVRLPVEFWPLLAFHCRPRHGGRAALMREAQHRGGSPWLLLAPRQGGRGLKQFDHATLCARFVAAQPPGARVTIRMARSIFATAFRDSSLAREHEQGAAALMGSSSAAWDAVYDRVGRVRGAQRAADAMGALRAQLLPAAAPAAQAPAQHEGSWSEGSYGSSAGPSSDGSWGGGSSGCGSPTAGAAMRLPTTGQRGCTSSSGGSGGSSAGPSSYSSGSSDEERGGSGGWGAGGARAGPSMPSMPSLPAVAAGRAARDAWGMYQ